MCAFTFTYWHACTNNSCWQNWWILILRNWQYSNIRDTNNLLDVFLLLLTVMLSEPQEIWRSKNMSEWNDFFGCTTSLLWTILSLVLSTSFFPFLIAVLFEWPHTRSWQKKYWSNAKISSQLTMEKPEFTIVGGAVNHISKKNHYRQLCCT